MSGMRATSAPNPDVNRKNSPPFDNGGEFLCKVIQIVSNFEEIRIYFRQGAPQSGLSCPCGAIHLPRLLKTL